MTFSFFSFLGLYYSSILNGFSLSTLYPIPFLFIIIFLHSPPVPLFPIPVRRRELGPTQKAGRSLMSSFLPVSWFVKSRKATEQKTAAAAAQQPRAHSTSLSNGETEAHFVSFFFPSSLWFIPQRILVLAPDDERPIGKLFFILFERNETNKTLCVLFR